MSTANSQYSQVSAGSEPRTEFHTPAQSPTPTPAPLAARRAPEPVEPPPIPTREREAEPSPRGLPSQPPPTSPLPQVPKASEAAPSTNVVEQNTSESVPTPASPTKTTSPTEEDGEVQHRPGLGPMIKKKAKAETANALRKAAFAAGAFKPRAGGAAAKLFAKETKPSDEPDGISGVFVPQRKDTADKKVEEEGKQEPEPEQVPKAPPPVETEPVPSVTVSSPLSPTPTTTTVSEKEQSVARSPTPEKAVVKEQESVDTRRKKRRSNQQIMNISKLGIDSSILDDRGLEFENLLSEFGWWGSDLSAKSIDTLEHDIKSEIARVEAGSWLNHLDQKDDRVEAVERMLDRAIAECDELEGLLTLYNVELSVSTRLS